MEKEKWAFIDSGNCSPGYNMAMDEKLMHWHSEGRIPPVIRFYGWNPATLSIGYFQQSEKEINLQKVKESGIGFVRRATGGRAVLHEHELTYSVIVSENHENIPVNVTEAYRVISEGLLKGFQHLGFHSYFSVPATEAERQKLRDPKSAICFDAPSWYELVVEGKKIAGSAQTRQQGIVLQHGAILMDLDQDKLFDLFQYKDEEAKLKMMASFRDKAVAIHDLSDRRFSIGEIKSAFRSGFEEGLHIQLCDYQLTRDMHEEIIDLCKEKYENDEWNFMR